VQRKRGAGGQRKRVAGTETERNRDRILGSQLRQRHREVGAQMGETGHRPGGGRAEIKRSRTETEKSRCR
jgi:hypothetical protein